MADAGDDREAGWRVVARPLVAVAYGGILAWTSWGGGMNGDGGDSSLVLGLLSLVAWIAISILAGYLLPRLVFVLIPVAIAIPAFVGERGEEFDNELRYFNWLLIAVISAIVVAPGVWLAHRRGRAA